MAEYRVMVNITYTLLLQFNMEKGHFYIINKLLIKLFAAKIILTNNHKFRAWNSNPIFKTLLKNKTPILKGKNRFLVGHILKINRSIDIQVGFSISQDS